MIALSMQNLYGNMYIGVSINSSCYKVALQKIADASHNDVHVYPEWYDAINAFISAIERKALSTVVLSS